MKHPFFRSVKSQLALLVMISLLPMLAIFVYTALDRRSKVIEDAKANALQVVRDVAFQQKQVAETTRHLLMTVTKVPDVRNQNAPACNRLFGELLNENPVYADIFSANAESPRELLETVTDVENQLYVNPENRQRLKELYTNQDFVSNFDTQLYRKDGTKIWVSMSARTVRDADGKIVHYEGTIEDITQSKELRDALKMAEREKSLILNAIPEMVLFHDNEMKILWVNKTAYDLLGRKTNGFVGRHCYEVWHKTITYAKATP